MKRFFLIIIFLLLLMYIHPNSSRKEIVAALFRSVENWMGTEYEYGGITKSGVDCSAFVAKVYKEVFNKDLPRTVKEQKGLGNTIIDKLQPGDLVFFKINDKIAHVGIYVFNNKFIHAASSGPATGVIKSSLNVKYYKKRFAFAKRIIKLPPFVKEEKNKKTLDTHPEILFGKVLFQGRLLEYSEKFYADKPIFLEIKRTPDCSNVKIAIKKIGKNMVEELNIYKKEEIVVAGSETQKEFNKVYLPNGAYQFELITDENNIVFQKNILVN